MTAPPDEELDRMLSRGRLGGPAREQMLERVLSATAPKKSRMASVTWAGFFAFATAGAVAATVVLVQRQPDGAFTSKGGSGGVSPRLTVECLDGDRARCRVGGTLVFRAEECAMGGYMAAYAQRSGTQDRTWYFPSTDDTSLPAIAADAESQVLPRGVRIDPTTPPGAYDVTLVLAKRPLKRDQVADPANPDVVHRWTSKLEIVP